MDANQVKCGIKNLTSIPAVASVDFIYLAIVYFDTGLYDFNDFIDETTLPLISSAVSRYFVKQYAEHIYVCLKGTGETYWTTTLPLPFIKREIHQ